MGIESLSGAHNILARSATLVGVDIVYDTVHQMLLLTQDFAN